MPWMSSQAIAGGGRRLVQRVGVVRDARSADEFYLLAPEPDLDGSSVEERGIVALALERQTN